MKEKIQNGLVVVVVAGVSVFASQKYRGENRINSHEVLAKVVNEVNKQAPMMVDAETELMNAHALDGVIGYNYRMVNFEANELDPQIFIDQVRPATVNSVCTTPETRDSFLKNDITMRYTYYGRSREFVVSFDVTRADCGF